jgi:hypothetical protein
MTSHRKAASRFGSLGRAAVTAVLLVGARPLAAAAQAAGPAARLAAAFPDLFPPESLTDAADAGLEGARVGAPTAPQRELGLQEGDFVLGVEGRALAGPAWDPAGLGPGAVFLVARRLPGQRPVLPSAVVGTQVLDEFVALTESERTPMRLARMAANQLTLVKSGTGVLLVPAAANRDDAEWLRTANPMPEPSEAAVREVRDAVRKRVRLPFVEGGEAAAALQAFKRKHWYEARERAGRALLQYAADPANRGQREPFDPLVQAYAQSALEVERERRALQQPGPLFALVFEGMYSRVDGSLPQQILFTLDGSDGAAFTFGGRVSLSPLTGGLPVLRNLHLLVEYGLQLHTFSGPPRPPTDGSFYDPNQRLPLVETTQHLGSLELLYRPRVLSWLRPSLHGGPALFHVSARAHDSQGVEREQASATTLGWVAGFGIDLFYHRPSHTRVTFDARVQGVTHRFCPDDAPNWESASNILEIDALGPSRPWDLDCYDAVNNPGAFIYELDMDAWQLGLMLAYEF